MTLKRIYAAGVLGLAVSVLAITQAQALRPVVDESRSQDTRTSVAALREDLREEVEQKREAARERVEAKRAEVQEKLADKRLEICEKREAKINSIISKSATQSQKHLEVFEQIEERVKTFYEDKNLSVENYDALLAVVDEKHTAATAEVALASETVFDCANAESTNPGGIVKDVINSKTEAIKDYRTALKDLIVAIKGASTSTDTTDDSTEPVEQEGN